MPRLTQRDTIMCHIQVGSSLIHPADGAAHFEIVFRLVVFKPFVGEVITGKVLECNTTGIKVGLDFFQNNHIPYYHLFEPSRFDEQSKAWIWDDGDEDDGQDDDEEENEPLAITKGRTINFKVHDINFIGKTYSVKGVHTMESKVAGNNNLPGPPVRKRSQSFDKGKSWEEGGNLNREENTISTTMEIIGVMR